MTMTDTTDRLEGTTTTVDDDTSTPNEALHEVLLAVAGRAPDDLLTVCREWVAADRTLDVARAVTFAALTYRVPLMEPHVIVLADVLASGGVDPSVLRQADVATADTPPPFLFSTDPEPALEGDEAEARDARGAAATAAAAEIPHARGLWRAVRVPSDGSPWPLGRDVHVLEVGPEGDRSSAAAALSRALTDAGENLPQVECYATGERGTSYLQLARAGGSLLWAHSPDREIAVAVVFDHVDDDGVPSFEDDHPVIEDQEERDRVVSYLDGGEILMTTTSLGNDYRDPERGEVVPMTFRTDGTWIWTDALTYYVREHGLRPQEELMDHVDSAPEDREPIDGIDVYRAMRVLMG